jgi:hypothetical protein
VPVQSYAESSCCCTPVECPSGWLSPVPVPGAYCKPAPSIPSNKEEEEASAHPTPPQNVTDEVEDNGTPIPEVVPVCGCVASALFACCLVSDGVPHSADALIAKGLSCVYETEEHLSFNQAMEHTFAVIASKLFPEMVEPKLFRQAMSGPDADKWYKSCMAEMQAHFENGTWQLVQLPAGHKAIGSKWVFKIKQNTNGSVERFKACLVAQGFSQHPGVNYTETFAPTTKWAALRTVFALTTIENMEMESIDISNTYLNG